MKTIKAQAHANIALIKYWGKRDETLFLPTKSSLSLTLPTLTTTTVISLAKEPNDEIRVSSTKFSKTLRYNFFALHAQKPLPTTPIGYDGHGRANGSNIESSSLKQFIQQNKNHSFHDNIVRFLDLFRQQFGITDHFVIESENSFPTAAGLASSASGFAALAKGLNKLYNLGLSNKELSILARRGSGSACRSIYDGFVLWHKGNLKDGSDSYAEQLFDANHWPELCIIPVIVNSQKKPISSRVGMQQTIATSPTYNRWIQESEKRIPIIIKAIAEKDFKTVGQLAEADCLQMHKCMHNSTPTLNYWQPQTIEIMNKVKALRAQGVPCYFTIDAGPNVKILTLREHGKDVDRFIKTQGSGISSIIQSPISAAYALKWANKPTTGLCPSWGNFAQTQRSGLFNGTQIYKSKIMFSH